MGRYVIVGNGVTGTRAAEVLRRRDPEGSITLLTDEPYPFYRRPQLADFAAGQAGEARLWAKRPSFYEEQRLDLRLGTPVAAVDAAAHEVVLGDGSRLGYDRLLVATGRRAGGPAGDGSRGANTFKTLDEAKAIREADGAGKRGAVFGDGLLGLEMVRALTGAGFSTTYLVPGERLWPEVLDAEAADIAAARVRAAGAEIRYKASVTGVDQAGTSPAGLVLSGGERVAADLVGICTGYEPSVGFLPDGGKDARSTGTYATPWDDIYIAGDVLVSPDRPYFNWLRSWRQGSAAGTAMVEGTPGAIDEVDTLNMQVLGLSLVAIGKTVTAYRSGYTHMSGDYPYGEFYKKLVFDPEGILVGALLVGGVAEAGALEEAIRARTPKAELEPSLLHQMFDRTYRTSYLGVQCPVCRHEFQLSRGAQEGDLVTCPICGMELTLHQGPQGFVARGAR